MENTRTDDYTKDDNEGHVDTRAQNHECEKPDPRASTGGKPTGAGGNWHGERPAVDADFVYRSAPDGAWGMGRTAAIAMTGRSRGPTLLVSFDVMWSVGGFL